jgi:hypothetical protein
MSQTLAVKSVAFALLLVASTAFAAADPSSNPTLIDIHCICEDAPHSAFTSLVHFGDRWMCAFRQASAHKGGTRDSRIRVLVSSDAQSWQTAATLSDPRGDIRDAKMAIMPDGRIILLTAIQLFDHGEHNHQSIAWFTKDLKTWDGPFDVGEPDVWLWGIVWHKGVGYSAGYSTKAGHFVRLYKTTDGRSFQPLVDKFDVGAVFDNENAITFDADDTARILIRCDPEPAFLGSARPPYTEWTLKQTDTRIGGPALTETPDGRLLAAGRLYDGNQRTSLVWIDPRTAKVTECLSLPSGGDTSYPGLVWDNDVLNMSYYSSHEGKAKIYFARVRVPSSASAISDAP